MRILSIDTEKINLDKDTLKLYAMIFMFIDHLAIFLEHVCGLFPGYNIMRLIGRMAFPIYAFCIVDGFKHTRDEGNYLMRLSFLCGVSMTPYSLFMCGKPFECGSKNVIFTYIFAVAAFIILKYGNDFISHIKNRDKKAIWAILYFIIFAVIFVGMFILRLEYCFCGSILMYAFYKYDIQDAKTRHIWYFVTALFVLDYGIMSIMLLPAFHLIRKYDGTMAKATYSRFEKIINYAFYPLHLLLLSVMWFV